jgi:hypothetical protein
MLPLQQLIWSICVFEGIFDLLSYREIHKSNYISEDYFDFNSLVSMTHFSLQESKCLLTVGSEIRG